MTHCSTEATRGQQDFNWVYPTYEQFQQLPPSIQEHILNGVLVKDSDLAKLGTTSAEAPKTSRRQKQKSKAQGELILNLLAAIQSIELKDCSTKQLNALSDTFADALRQVKEEIDNRNT